MARQGVFPLAHKVFNARVNYWLQYSLQIWCGHTSQSLHAPIAACINITAYHDTNYFNPTDFRMKYSAHTAPATPARVSTAATHSGSITGAWTAENFWRLWYHGTRLLRANLVSSWRFRRRALIWSDMRLSCWQTSTQLYPDCAPLTVTGSGSKLPSEEYTYLVSSWLALRLIYYQPTGYFSIYYLQVMLL